VSVLESMSRNAAKLVFQLSETTPFRLVTVTWNALLNSYLFEKYLQDQFTKFLPKIAIKLLPVLNRPGRVLLCTLL